MEINKILEINNLAFSYVNTESIISNISFNIRENSKTAIIGSNGCGKTTLFLLISGILKANKGNIIANNNPIIFNSFNSDIAYLFQSPEDQLFSATVWDDIAFGPRNMNLDNKYINDKVSEVLKLVNCEELSNKAPHHLSGGQKSLVALASILSMDPKIMLLDEVTANLDHKNRRNIINILNSLNITMLVSSHDLEFLIETCTDIILMDNGNIVASGNIIEILSNKPLLQQFNMEIPHSLIPHSHKNSVEGIPINH